MEDKVKKNANIKIRDFGNKKRENNLKRVYYKNKIKKVMCGRC